MIEQVKPCLEKQKQHLESAIAFFEKELSKIRAGKATPQMLEGVKVDYYGSLTALDQVAAINTPDPKQIVIQPWEKTLLKAIEKAIIDANLGFNPQNTGELIRINLPPITEERRKELVKKTKAEGESAKVAIRNTRRDANEEIKKLEKAGLPEDAAKQAEKDIQDQTNKYSELVEKLLVEKEKDIMTV